MIPIWPAIYIISHELPKPICLEVFMVNNLVFRWPKPLFFTVLRAHGLHLVCKTLTRREFKLTCVKVSREDKYRKMEKERDVRSSIFLAKFFLPGGRRSAYLGLSLCPGCCSPPGWRYIFSRGSWPKPLFATGIIGILEGGPQPNAYFFAHFVVSSHKRLIRHVFTHLIHFITKHFRYLKWGNPHL